MSDILMIKQFPVSGKPVFGFPEFLFIILNSKKQAPVLFLCVHTQKYRSFGARFSFIHIQNHPVP